MEDTVLTPTRRRSRLRRVIVVLLAVAAALVALVGILAYVLPAQRAWELGVVSVAPYLMLAGPVALILFALARQWSGLLVAVLLVAAAGSTQLRLFTTTSVPNGTTDVVVMTSNLYLGNADAEQVVDAVRRHHVEVLMLEELTPQVSQRLRAAGLDSLLPYTSSVPGLAAYGTGLWSRYPLRDDHEPAGLVLGAVAARVEVPGVATSPTFVALHLAGPVPDATDWRADIAHLPGVLAAQPPDGSVIVGGDFNATPNTRQFRDLLRNGYVDAADQAGAGITRTWPANRWYPPLIAIDHVLTRRAVAHSVSTVHIAGTDHRALLVTVAVPRSS